MPVAPFLWRGGILYLLFKKRVLKSILEGSKTLTSILSSENRENYHKNEIEKVGAVLCIKKGVFLFSCIVIKEIGVKNRFSFFWGVEIADRGLSLGRFVAEMALRAPERLIAPF